MLIFIKKQLVAYNSNLLIHNLLKMSRKQSAKDILKTINQDSSHQSNPSISTTQLPSTSTHRTRMSVKCHCKKCNGKLVDPRTKHRHSLTTGQQRQQLPQTGLNELRQPTRIASELSGLSQQSVTIDSCSDNEIPSSHGNELPSSLDMDNLSFLPKKRRQTSRAKMTILDTEKSVITSEDESSDNNIMLNYNNSDDDDSLSEELTEGIRYSHIDEFEDYSAPNIDYEEFRSSPRVSSIYDDILIWLLKFQSRFKVSEEATEVLVKYIRQLLCEFGDENLFENFPSSIHKLRKHLKIDDFITYSVCPSCNKLYTKKEVVNSQNNNGQLSIKKCNHVEFPNIIGSRQIVTCNSALAIQNRYLRDTINKPILLYPFVRIKSQLEKMYMRPNFEQLCRKWTHRTVPEGILSDIYNGQI